MSIARPAQTVTVDQPIAKIHLELNPDPELVRLARLVVSGVASVTPMGLEEVEDCRAGVDEMCSTLLEVGVDDEPVHLDIESDGTTLEVRGSLAIRSAAEMDETRRELSEMILEAVTDTHEIQLDGPRARFRFTKGVRRGGPVG